MNDAFVIHLVDDDPSFLTAVSRLVSAAGYAVRTFRSASEFLNRADADSSGCVVIDLRMPGLDGMGLQAAVTRTGNPLPVIILTGHGDIPTSVHAMRLGAVDFLTKPVEKDALLNAIQRAVALDVLAREHRARLRECWARFQRLTSREREVMSYVATGWLNKQIAGKLGTAERTVKAHRAAVMSKVGVKSVAELVRFVEMLAGRD